MNTDLMFSSKSDDWETPQDLFDRLNAEYGFTLDVCASAGNAKCRLFFSKEQDGLAQDWRGFRCWMNPPYGRSIGLWVGKAHRSFQGANKGLCVCLLPSRTDTAWWHDYVMKANTLIFLRGRLKFGGHKNSAPFPSALVLFS